MREREREKERERGRECKSVRVKYSERESGRERGRAREEDRVKDRERGYDRRAKNKSGKNSSQVALRVFFTSEERTHRMDRLNRCKVL